MRKKRGNTTVERSGIATSFFDVLTSGSVLSNGKSSHEQVLHHECGRKLRIQNAIHDTFFQIDDVFFDKLKCWYDDLKQASCSKLSSTFCDCFTDDANECLPLNHCNMITKSEFLHQIFSCHINPCLTFANQDLSHAVSSYIHRNLLSVEQASNQATGESQ